MKWHISTQFSTRPRIDDENGTPVASVFTRSVTDWDRKAQLIAAAPELLAALRVMVERYTSLVNCGDCGNWDPESEAQVLAARTAIAKATQP